MAKANFSSSIGSALEGRVSNPHQNLNVQPQKKETKPIEPVKIVDSITVKQENVVPVKKIDPIIVKPQIVTNKEVTSIGFNLTKEDARFIQRTSIRDNLTREALFETIFRDSLSLEIDEYDPDYEEFVERSKKDVRFTTKIDPILYQDMKKHAQKSYLKIGGYINYVIRKYRLSHEKDS